MTARALGSMSLSRKMVVLSSEPSPVVSSRILIFPVGRFSSVAMGSIMYWVISRTHALPSASNEMATGWVTFSSAMFLMVKPSVSWRVARACLALRSGAGGISEAGMGAVCGRLSLLSPSWAKALEMLIRDTKSRFLDFMMMVYCMRLYDDYY